MRSRWPRGATKPPLGAQIDWAHPFAKNFIIGTWANQPVVQADIATMVYTGRATANRAGSAAFASTPIMTSNQDGAAFNFTAVSDYVDLGIDPIPAARVTACLIRRKSDTTNRNPGIGWAIGDPANGAVFDATRCCCFLPFSDGVVYWDFGGFTGGTTRLSVGSLSFSTTIPERWIFIAGSKGMAIWRNGVKVASQGTANPGRTVDTTKHLRLNRAGVSTDGDIQQTNFFMALDEEWDDNLCRWWSAEPYAHLYEPTIRSIMAMGGAAAAGGGTTPTSTFPALTVAY